MFRNKIVVRASPPSSSSPFFLIPLSLSPAGYPSPRSPSASSFHPIDLEALCCKLSRAKRLACFLHSDDIFIIYQRSQTDSAARVIEEVLQSLPSINVGVEEEVKSASLIAKAVECWLRSIMLENGWRCVGENSFVQSTFDCSEERKHLCAINVRVQAESGDRLIFLVSPDVLWFRRHKISELASSRNLENFENGMVVILEECGLSTSCTVLPSLYEGHVIGLSKQLPAGETFSRYEKLWLLKHGLALPNNYFLDIQFSYRGHMNRQWLSSSQDILYPSAFVLQGPGLAPAPQTIRASKALHALEFFVNTVGGWDFFFQGLLKVEEVSPLGTVTIPVWKTATRNLKDVTVGDNIPCTREAIGVQTFSLNNIHLALDFRTPKPAFGRILGKKHIDILETSVLSSKRIMDSRVKGTHDVDITKLSSVAQSMHSESERVNENNVAEKNHTPAVYFMRKVTAAKSADTSESWVTEKKHTSSEDNMIKITTEESVIINERRRHETIEAEKKLNYAKDCTNAEDCTSGVTTAESDLVSGVTTADSDLARGSTVTKKKHTSTGECMIEQGVLMQKVEENVQSSYRASQRKEETLAFLDKKCLADSITVHSKEAVSGTYKKMKTKQHADTQDIIAKVMDYHNRGSLQSLTIPDLKSFLTTKKAKVGGKKEELVQRITALLA